MKISLLALILSLNTFASVLEFSKEETSYLQNKKEITICINPNGKPLEFFDKNGIHSGFTSDYMKLIESKVGIPVKVLKTKTWYESLEAFKNKKCDLLPSIVKTEKRAKEMSFTPLLFTIPNVIISNNKKNKIESINELYGKKVAVVKGYAFTELLKSKYPKLELIQLNNSKTGLTQVSTNEIDFFIDFTSSATFYIDELALNNVKYVGRIEDLDLNLRMATHIDQNLLSSIITKAADSISQNEVDILRRKWIYLDLEDDHSSLIQALILLSSVLLILLIWVLILKRAFQFKARNVIEREEYSKMLFESSPIALALCDMDGVLIDVNPAFCSLIGYDKKEAMALSYWDITPKSFEAQEAEQIEKLKKFNKYGPYEKYYIHRDKSLIPVRLNGQIVQKDGVDYIWSSIENISESKAQELRLKDTNALLEQKVKERTLEFKKASQAKSEFLATMSHELRTPLNGILGPVELLKNMDSNTQEQNELLNTAQVSADQMYLIINDILDFTKIESGELNFEILEFNLQQLLKNIQQMVKPQILEKDIELEILIDEDVSENIIGDSTRLTQILLNLVSNAIKFTNEGSIKIKISNLEKDNNKFIEFSVIDTGIGLEESKIPYIFQPFFQADSSTTRVFGGTGLGLTIVKKLIEHQNGIIECISELNKGSTFRFYLPVLTKDKIKNSQMSQSIQPHKSSTLNILVVEDNPLNQIVTKKMLQKLNHTITIVVNGLEATQEVQKNNYDIIFMDWRMPVMDGIEATKIIREMAPPLCDIPIIGLTANVFKEDIKRCKEAGMNDVVKKPVKINELSIAITKNIKK